MGAVAADNDKNFIQHLPGGAGVAAARLHIEAQQSVMPAKVTEPRQFHILQTLNPESKIFKRRFHIILFYDKVSQDDSGWLVGGWLRDSLSIALLQHPILSGRLRHGRDGQKEMEIVSNDSGVRLVEASCPNTMSEVLDHVASGQDLASQLVSWQDIDQQYPELCPLLYIQVTNFEDGGYALGASCSFLLTDPITMTNFLKRWSIIHQKVLVENFTKLPNFYLPKFKSLGLTPPIHLSTNPPGHSYCNTFIFQIAASDLNQIIQKVSTDKELYRTVASLCLQSIKCSTTIGTNNHAGVAAAADSLAKNFSLLVKLPSGGTMAEFCKEFETEPWISSFSSVLKYATWDDMEINDIVFRKGSMQLRSSKWVESVSVEAFVMLLPAKEDAMSSASDMTIFAAIPNKGACA